MKKTLIVYFSYTNGNTQRIAEAVQKATGGDIVRLEVAEPYTGSYDDVVALAKKEAAEHYQHPFKPIGANVADYEVIAVGTPTWWYTMASVVLTFLNSQDWHGKTVIPFMTNAGWPGKTIRNMKKACAGAEFACEKEFLFDSEGGAAMQTPEAELAEWLENVRTVCNDR